MKWYCWQSLGSGPGPTLDGRYRLIDPKARHRSRPDAQPVRRSAFPEGSAATTQRSASSRADVDRPSVTPPTPSIIDASPPEKLLTFNSRSGCPAAAPTCLTPHQRRIYREVAATSTCLHTGASIATTRRIYKPMKEVAFAYHATTATGQTNLNSIAYQRVNYYVKVNLFTTYQTL